MSKNKKILVAMSGGVDSSVVASLLVKKGYNVTGMFAVNFEDKDSKGIECWRGDYEDALRVCAKLGIKLLRWNFVEEYKKQVLDYLYRTYEQGFTPNPDVMCNKFIKFGVWLEKAKQEGFDYVATGHYARLRRENLNSKSVNLKLILAKDKNKDQTYFLHQLNQEQLKHILFPLGKLTKKRVRKLAEKFNLPTKDKKESMGICFVGEVAMDEFLKDKVKAKTGDIVLSNLVFENDGKVLKVGKHKGLAFYTIGQKIRIDNVGFRIQNLENKKNKDSRAFYIVDKDLENNSLVVGYDDDPLLYKKKIKIKYLHWISGQKPNIPIKCYFRLRHRQELQKGILEFDKKSEEYRLLSEKKQRAVAKGQFAVIYKKRLGGKYECLGGGVIS